MYISASYSNYLIFNDLLKVGKNANQSYPPPLRATVVVKDKPCICSTIWMGSSLQYTTLPTGTNQPFHALWKENHDQFLRNSSNPLP